jgi:hypothetical protein
LNTHQGNLSRNIEHLKHLLGEDVNGVVAAGGEKLVRDFLALSRVVLFLERPQSFHLENLRS